MNLEEVTQGLCVLRLKMRTELLRLAPSQALWVNHRQLPAYIGEKHPEFAELHAAYVDVGEALKALVRV